MNTSPLFTRCSQCSEEITISREAIQIGRLTVCPACGTPAYVYQLIGRVNREPAPVATELNGTWEGAAA